MPRQEQTVAYGTETVLPATALRLAMFTTTGKAKISESVFGQITTTNSIVVGQGAVMPPVNAVSAVLIGHNAVIQGGAPPYTGAIAIGFGASAEARYGIAIGTNANTAPGSDGIAIGRGASTGAAGAADRISIGRSAGGLDTSVGTASIAIGYGASGRGASNASIAMGFFADSGGAQSIAVGHSAAATHTNSISIGYVAASTQIGEVTFGAAAFGAVTLISFRPAAGTPVRHRNSADGWAIRDVGNLNDIFKVDESAVAGDVRLLLWDVTAGALKRVTMAAAGAVPAAGFRALQVPV